MIDVPVGEKEPPLSGVNLIVLVLALTEVGNASYLNEVGIALIDVYIIANIKKNKNNLILLRLMFSYF